MVAWEGAEFDDDDEGGDEPHRPVPDPQDRLWRHPSELPRQAESTGPGASGGHRARRRRRPHAAPRSRFLGIALATGAVGALAAALLVYAAARPQLGTTSVVSTTGSGFQGASEGSSAEAVAAGTTQTSAAVRVGPGVWAMVQRLLPAVVAVDAATSHGERRGTGFVFRPDGVILTSSRLVNGANTVTVVARNGRQWSANVVGTDGPSQVAVLRVPATGLPSVPLDPGANLRAGQLTLVLAVGHRSGDPPAVTIGRVDAVHTDNGPTSIPGAIQTDARPPDPPGSILLDDQGKVIGLMQATVQRAGGTVGSATPASEVQNVASQLLAGGPVVRSWLGVTGSSRGSDRPPSGSVPGGAVIDQVTPGSPAALAGLQPGEVITSLDGRAVDSMAALRQDIMALSPGSVVTLGLGNSQGPGSATVTLAGRPG